jgi:iron complex transport system substrate-binding protein
VLRRLAVALALAALPALAAAAEVTDATGRTVAIPDAPDRIYPAGPPAAVLLYVLKPEALVGWAHAPRERDAPYLLAASLGLPATAPLTGPDGAVDLDALGDADLVVDYGTVDARYAEAAERVQAASGVPSILLDGALDMAPATLRRLGAAIGAGDRGEALAAYAEETLALVDATLAGVPEADRPRFYLARGADGLQSARPGSINAEALARAGGINVVDVEGSGNLVDVTIDQIVAWAPDVIVTISPEFAAMAAASPDWARVPAVAAGRVLVAPAAPFGFVDSPPSVNRLIGLRWLMHALYPAQAQGEIRPEIARFYGLFYQVEPSDADLDRLLGG